MSNPETIKAEKVIEAGQLVQKIIVLINGGASVALLAFVGNVWSPGSIAPLTIIFLAIGLAAFSLGVLSGAKSALHNYLSGTFSLADVKDLSRLHTARSVRASILSLALFFLGMCTSIIAILVHFFV